MPYTPCKSDNCFHCTNYVAGIFFITSTSTLAIAFFNACVICIFVEKVVRCQCSDIWRYFSILWWETNWGRFMAPLGAHMSLQSMFHFRPYLTRLSCFYSWLLWLLSHLVHP